MKNASNAEEKCSISYIERPTNLPYNSDISILQICFKISANFLFDTQDFDGHHGLFPKGDIVGCKSGWLVNANSGIIAVHLCGWNGQWREASQLIILSSDWNRISVEQFQDGDFSIRANGISCRFPRYL